MSKKVDFKLDLNGLRELMKGPEMRQQLEKHAERVAQTASNMSGGEDFGTRYAVLDYTAVCTIYPDSKAAAHDNYENNTLLKSLSGSGSPKE